MFQEMVLTFKDNQQRVKFKTFRVPFFPYLALLRMLPLLYEQVLVLYTLNKIIDCHVVLQHMCVKPFF
jgi:hypothetical protein